MASPFPVNLFTFTMLVFSMDMDSEVLKIELNQTYISWQDTKPITLRPAASTFYPAINESNTYKWRHLLLDQNS